MKMDIYGKVKNGRLIKAPKLYVRDGDINRQDDELYNSLGYKKVIFRDAPANRAGYNLHYIWEEKSNCIEQVWNFSCIEEDYSSELLCSIRDFNFAIDCIINTIHEVQQKNLNKYQRILREDKVLKIIWEKRHNLDEGETLLTLFHKCDLNILSFFETLSITSDIQNLGYEIYPQFMVRVDDKAHVWPFTYIKSTLSNIYSLYSFSNLESRSTYDMAYIYAYTIFDELLLKFARYICKLERNWLASNTTLTFKDVIGCKSLEEIHEMLINQKIDELSWKSYLDKISFFNSHGVNVNEVDASLFKDTMLFIAEKRNVIVHNGGVWNTTVYNKLKVIRHCGNIRPNTQVERSVESIESECGESLRKAANTLYDLLCSKFNLINRYNVDLEKE